jgi:single-stranded-DNA-specific exonuclease
MKYNLIQPNPKQTTDFDNIQNTILLNRGIEQPEHYLNTTSSDIIHYSKLDNIDKAYDQFNDALVNNKGIGIVCDSDADGYFSASILYQALCNFKASPKVYFHSGKEHGLSDKTLLPEIIKDVQEGKINLLFLPDSGTNDEAETRQLYNLGCNVICLDHHISEKKNNWATIVNPQISDDYPNKFASGTVVVWQFIRKLSDEFWSDEDGRYLDMVAFSTISDSMDLRSFENKELLRLGLLHITNKLLKAFIDKQDYFMKGEITPITVAFNVIPLINGLVRAGDQSEKELMFKAFCQQDEFFEYTKRDKSVIQESIYDRVARLAANCKAKQDRMIEKSIEIIEKDIVENNRDKNKILFAKATDDLDKSFGGLTAMKLANKYNRPCVLLREGKNDYWSGSIRNFNGSPLTNLKDFLQSLGYVQWIQGHANAAGIGLTLKQLKKTIELSNEKLHDYDFSPIHQVDFELTPDDLTAHILSDLYSMRHHYGQQIPEALLLIKNIKLNSSQIQFLGKGEEKNTWKFPLTSEIDIIKFRIDKSDILLVKYGGELSGWGGEDIEMNVICKVGMNTFNGESKYQLIVQDYEIV